MKVLRSKSGVSLMFVLATMMLLMVIGVSAIVAAGYNVGAGVVQHNRTQLELYASSMERTIKVAFDEEEVVGTLLTNSSTLGGRIIHEIIRGSTIFPASAADDVMIGAIPPINIDIRIELEPDDTPETLPDGVDATYTLQIEGWLYVFINPYQRHHTENVFGGVDDDDNEIIFYIPVDATPMTATITGDIIVHLITEYTPVGGLNQQVLVPYTFESVTTYRLDTVDIIENPVPFDVLKTAEPTLGVMRINSPVLWTVIRYESFGW